MADVVAERAGDGDAVYVQDYHFSLLGQMVAEARPDLRTVHFLHTPFAAPDMLAVLPDDVAGRAARRHGRLLRPAASTPPAGRPASWPATPPPGRTAPPTFVAPLGPDAAVLEEEAAGARVHRAAAAACGPRWVRAGSSPAATAWSRPRTSCAACSPSRSCSPPTREWRGQVVHVAQAYPSRQGLAEYLAYAADVEHTAERINHRFGGAVEWLDADRAVGRGRLGPLARRADGGGRPAGQPRPRRPEPRGQGGRAAQRGRRRPGAVAPGRRLGGVGARRAGRTGDQPLRPVRHRRGAACRADHGGRRAR